MDTKITTLDLVVAKERPNPSVTIKIASGDLPIVMQVFFCLDFTQAFGRWQNVTTCGLRFLPREVTKTGKVHYGKTAKTYWGNTIQNPHDSHDTRRGRQVAFRRAFAALVRDELELSDPNLVLALYSEARKAMFSAGAW